MASFVCRALTRVSALAPCTQPLRALRLRTPRPGPLVHRNRLRKWKAPLTHQWLRFYASTSQTKAAKPSGDAVDPNLRAQQEDTQLHNLLQVAKTHVNLLSEASPLRKALETHTVDEIMKTMTKAEKKRALYMLVKLPTDMDESAQAEYYKAAISAALVKEELQKDASSREDMIKHLAEPLPPKNAKRTAEEEEQYARSLDVRVQYWTAMAAMADASEEVAMEMTEKDLALRAIEMLDLSRDKKQVMCLLLKNLRLMASQEKTVEQMHADQTFVPFLVALLKAPDVSLRIEASALIALLTIVRDMVIAFKENGIVPLLTSILSSNITSAEQPVYNNGVVALVRIIAVSGDSIAEDLKKSQAVSPLCNIINKLDRTPSVHDAVVTLLTILSASSEIAIQIVDSGCIPSLSGILAAYTIFAARTSTRGREFRRVTSTGTKTAVSQEAAEGIVDDDDASEDSINPIYRGSDPEDIIPLMRLLSRVPHARPLMIKEGALTSFSRLIANLDLTFSQKTQATNTLVNFTYDSAFKNDIVRTGIVQTLIDQTSSHGTSEEEITFQYHAIAVLSLLSDHEEAQKHICHKYWLAAIIVRAPQSTNRSFQLAIGNIFLNLLKSDRSDEVRDIIASSEPISKTIRHMVFESQQKANDQNSIWPTVFSLI